MTDLAYNTYVITTHVLQSTDMDFRLICCGCCQNWSKEINKWLASRVGVLAIDSGSKAEIDRSLGSFYVILDLHLQFTCIKLIICQTAWRNFSGVFKQFWLDTFADVRNVRNRFFKFGSVLRKTTGSVQVSIQFRKTVGSVFFVDQL